MLVCCQVRPLVVVPSVELLLAAPPIPISVTCSPPRPRM